MKWRLDKSIVCLVVITLILTSYISPELVEAKINIKDNNTKAAVLMDQATGKVLFEDNKDSVMGQASITKLMTYYIVRDYMKEKKVPMDKEVKVDADFSMIPSDGTKINLKSGDIISIKDLLESLLIVSANDSAVQLEKVIEDETGSDFLSIMNTKARSIGLNKTVYINASGLSEGSKEDRNYNKTTAYEVAILSKKIIDDYPDTLKMTSKKSFTYKKTTYPNTNIVLANNKNVDGLKTGHTNEAGYCLSSTEAIKESGKGNKAFRLIAVTLGSDTENNRVKINEKLLSYGKENYENKKIINKEETIELQSEYHKKGKIPSKVKDDVYFLLNKSDKIEKKSILVEDLKHDIKKGEIVGTLIVKIGEATVEEDLIATEDVDKVNIFKRIAIFLRELF